MNMTDNEVKGLLRRYLCFSLFYEHGAIRYIYVSNNFTEDFYTWLPVFRKTTVTIGKAIKQTCVLQTKVYLGSCAYDLAYYSPFLYPEHLQKKDLIGTAITEEYYEFD